MKPRLRHNPLAHELLDGDLAISVGLVASAHGESFKASLARLVSYGIEVDRDLAAGGAA